MTDATEQTLGENDALQAHPHEPDIGPVLDDDGRCLVCALITDNEQHVEALRSQLAAAKADRDAWRVARLPDKEAEAIAGCVRALDAFADRHAGTSSGYGGSSSSFTLSDTGAVRRVLRFLAERYGVDPTFNVQTICDHQDPT
jgi:hypothetical protein